MRVFISHSSHDKPAVLALAEALRQRGFDPWVDKWQIQPGQDIVARINAGLAEADAGLIVFSAAAQASLWVQAEWSALTFARIEQGRPLIPLILGVCRALGRACAGASFGASLDVGEAWDRPPQRAGNDGWHRKSPRPFGLKLAMG